MKKIIALALWAAGSLAVSAQAPDDKVPILYCYGEDGCGGYWSPFTYPQLDWLMGMLGVLEEAGPGRPVVFLKNRSDEFTHYVDLRRSFTEINELFGGTGEPPFSTSFPDFAPIQPKDGSWTVATGNPAAENCPPGMADQVAAMSFAESGTITFTKPFSANQALPHSDVHFIPTRPGHYKALLISSELMSGRYDFSIESEEAMNGTLTTVVTIPRQTTCVVTMPVSYRRAGD